MGKPDLALSDWLSRLEKFSPREIDLGLDRMTLMLERLGLRPPPICFLIAGTNGKGSSVAMTNALLRALGYSVGCYTSPHLLRYNERIVVDDECAPDAAIVGAFERIEACRDELALTYFEYSTLAALVIFAEENVDAVLLEIGLGGRLDACNAVTPTASLITNISLDHCDWLGDTIDEIAVEKAGVMRANKPTVFSASECPKGIVDSALRVGATLIRAGTDFTATIQADGLWDWHSEEKAYRQLERPGLSGDFQIANAAGVIALLQAAGISGALDSDAISRALEPLSVPGRSQTIRARGRDWYLDVAHNPAAAAELAKSMHSHRLDGDHVAIIGMLDDKDAAGMIKVLMPYVDQWIAITPASPRAIPADQLASIISAVSGSACLIAGSTSEATEFARQVSEENDKIVVCGSFFTVGPVLAQLTSVH